MYSGSRRNGGAYIGMHNANSIIYNESIIVAISAIVSNNKKSSLCSILRSRLFQLPRGHSVILIVASKALSQFYNIIIQYGGARVKSSPKPLIHIGFLFRIPGSPYQFLKIIPLYIIGLQRLGELAVYNSILMDGYFFSPHGHTRRISLSSY